MMGDLVSCARSPAARKCFGFDTQAGITHASDHADLRAVFVATHERISKFRRLL